MAIREKFGRLVLLEETEGGALGREYRAARLGPTGLDRLVTVLRLSPFISAHAEATKTLVEGARLAARPSNPGLVRVLGIGRVEQSFYLSTELVEGRSLAAILERCRREAFPFAADHALMVATRAASALESLHARRDEAGNTLVHGLVAPSRVVVAFDGEVKIKGLGLWPALRGTDLLPPDERLYLAPEQAEGGPGGPRSDVYSLGLVLLEALTGQAPVTEPLDGLAHARLASAAGEQAPLPKPLSELLRKALARDPASRFAGMADLRKAVDALLFSGDFAPTTFDLAFFMHTLFREEMEAEARALEEARIADYREFLVEERPGVPAAALAPATLPEPAPVAAVPSPVATEVSAPTIVGSGPPVAGDRPSFAPEASDSRPSGARPAREVTAREAAARMTLGASAPSRSRKGLWLTLALLAVVLAGGGAGSLYVAKRRGPAPTPTTTLSPEAAAALARVRELEARISQLEREKVEAETAAAEEARRRVEAQAGDRPVDPAAVQQAQEEARRRARAEQERRQQEELARLANQRKVEEQRLAEASPSPAPAPEAIPVATPFPTPAALPAPTAATEVPSSALPPPGGARAASAPPPGALSALPPAATSGAPAVTPPVTADPALPPPPTPDVRRGALVEINDPTVTPPALVRQPAVVYPELARQARVEGVIELRALIDETGNVIEVRLVRSSRPGYRFEAEAERHMRGRKYRPATKDGVAVRIWLPVVVNFKLTR